MARLDKPSLSHNTDQHRRSAEASRRARAQDRRKPILFSMARLDRVKNLTGLVELYAKSERLRAACNLVIVGGIVDASQVRPPVDTSGWRSAMERSATDCLCAGAASKAGHALHTIPTDFLGTVKGRGGACCAPACARALEVPDTVCRVRRQTKDVEEKEQCERMHELIREYKLEGQLRWLVAQKDRVANGELYRYVAGAQACCCARTDANGRQWRTSTERGQLILRALLGPLCNECCSPCALQGSSVPWCQACVISNCSAHRVLLCCKVPVVI